MKQSIETYKLIFIGKVQGVGFRYWFKNLATQNNVYGYVKNLSNENKVESIIQGNKNNLLNIIEMSKVGPNLSIVEKIVSKKIISQEIYYSFLIKDN